MHVAHLLCSDTTDPANCFWKERLDRAPFFQWPSWLHKILSPGLMVVPDWPQPPPPLEHVSWLCIYLYPLLLLAFINWVSSSVSVCTLVLTFAGLNNCQPRRDERFLDLSSVFGLNTDATYKINTGYCFVEVQYSCSLKLRTSYQVAFMAAVMITELTDMILAVAGTLA